MSGLNEIYGLKTERDVLKLRVKALEAMYLDTFEGGQSRDSMNADIEEWIIGYRIDERLQNMPKGVQDVVAQSKSEVAVLDTEIRQELRAMEVRMQAKLEYLEAKLGSVAAERRTGTDRRGDQEVVSRITFPGEIHDPRIMPELRAALIDLAKPGGPWEQSEIQQAMAQAVNVAHVDGKQVPLDMTPMSTKIMAGTEGYSRTELMERMGQADAVGRKNIDWYRRNIPGAQLIYVAPELVDVIEQSCASIPDDYVIELKHLPSPTGLVVFGRPMWGIPAEDQSFGEEAIRVDAVMWGASSLKHPGESDTKLKNCVSSAVFRCMIPSHTDRWATEAYRNHEAHERHPVWLPLGRTDWPIGTPVDVDVHEQLTQQQQQVSMQEDRRIMAALWALIQQRRVVTQVELQPQRHVKRRLARAGHEAPPVTVVHLRAPEYQPRHADGSTGHTVGVRFMVRPHWRNQACGPNRSQRKLILIPPHIKGPADAPLVHSERVWAVDR